MAVEEEKRVVHEIIKRLNAQGGQAVTWFAVQAEARKFSIGPIEFDEALFELVQEGKVLGTRIDRGQVDAFRAVA